MIQLCDYGVYQNLWLHRSTVYNVQVNAKTVLRTFLAVLWVLFFVLYAAAKTDFFTGHNSGGIAHYLRKHSVYWVAMAATAFFIWLIEMFRSKSDR
jgi:hypothetical protein